MNKLTTLTQLAPPQANSVDALTTSPPTLPVVSEEEFLNFSTIDGNIVPQLAGASAVSNGAGVFIGDYFVGMADNFLTYSNLAIIQY
ncbi:hypothetical protein ACFSKU_04010 [Pontibacter silvestris]|uniref:Uncharacterized protein n=1 Tax=Pontibacter silvestris TaxID=2305183 RepID=A0ABW4WVM7_9BACT|nr:hypothetical protein [Pontibacter silvestris]MCC9137971.1 hypothetical protein [Pontibacter silvestris]